MYKGVRLLYLVLGLIGLSQGLRERKEVMFKK